MKARLFENKITIFFLKRKLLYSMDVTDEFLGGYYISYHLNAIRR